MEPVTAYGYGILILIVFAFAIIFTAMMILLPFYVASIRKEVIRLNKTVDRIAMLIAFANEK